MEKQADLIYLTYFNAGLRIYDIKDARLPKEVGWFIPPTPTVRRMPAPYDKLVSQTEDVLVDTRGNIYISNKQWGLFILKVYRPRRARADGEVGTGTPACAIFSTFARSARAFDDRKTRTG